MDSQNRGDGACFPPRLDQIVDGTALNRRRIAEEDNDIGGFGSFTETGQGVAGGLDGIRGPRAPSPGP